MVKFEGIPKIFINDFCREITDEPYVTIIGWKPKKIMPESFWFIINFTFLNEKSKPQSLIYFFVFQLVMDYRHLTIKKLDLILSNNFAMNSKRQLREKNQNQLLRNVKLIEVNRFCIQLGSREQKRLLRLRKNSNVAVVTVLNYFSVLVSSWIQNCNWETVPIRT